TASGAVAVQVARKDRGRVVILAHLGSAHTDAELGILLEQAWEMVVGGQAALDFEVAVRAQSMADVADFRAQALISERATPAVAAPVVPPGRTVGASSRLLYDVLGHVYDWLGFDAVGDAVFRDLVISRIVEPTSKLDASRVLADLGARLVSYKTIGACQDFCVCGWSEVGVDAVGVGGRELGEGLFPVGGDLSFDEAA